MKNFFAKKIKLFGKSVSLSLVTALLAVVVVAGAFLLTYSTSVSVTAGNGIQVEGTSIACSRMDGRGSIDVCT